MWSATANVGSAADGLGHSVRSTQESTLCGELMLKCPVAGSGLVSLRKARLPVGSSA